MLSSFLLLIFFIETYILFLQLARICPNLSPEEVSEVFAELDSDGNGQIDITEFSEGFKGITETVLNRSRYGAVLGVGIAQKLSSKDSAVSVGSAKRPSSV